LYDKIQEYLFLKVYRVIRCSYGQRKIDIDIWLKVGVWLCFKNLEFIYIRSSSIKYIENKILQVKSLIIHYNKEVCQERKDPRNDGYYKERPEAQFQISIIFFCLINSLSEAIAVKDIFHSKRCKSFFIIKVSNLPVYNGLALNYNVNLTALFA